MPVEVGLGIRNAGLLTGLEESKAKLNEFAASFTRQLAAPLIGLATVGGIEEGIAGALKYGEQLVNLHEQLGVSLEDLQKFGFALTQNGVSLEEGALFLNRLQVATSRAVDLGMPAYIKAFERLGVTVDDLRSKKPEEILLQIGRGSMDAADMVTVFGRNADKIVPTLEKLADGAQQFGAALSDIDVKRLDLANDQLERMKDLLTVMGAGLVSKIFEPALENALVGMKLIQLMLEGNAAEGGIGGGPRGTAALNDFMMRWGIMQMPATPDAGPRGPLDPDGDGDGGDSASSERPRRGRENDEPPLAQRLADIAAEADEKKKSIDAQIADLKQKQAIQQRFYDDYSVWPGDEEQKAEYADKLVETQKEINRLQEEGDHAHAEAAKAYADLKAENDRREQKAAIEAETDPEKKKALLDADIAQDQARADALKKQFEAMPAGIDREKLRKDYDDLMEEIAGEQRDRKELDPKKEEAERRSPQERYRPNSIEEIAALSSYQFRTGQSQRTVDAPLMKEIKEHVGNTATDMRYIRQVVTQSGGQGAATFQGDF